MGFPTEVRDFIRWYASFQLPDGKIPCCIDKRGADAVAGARQRRAVRVARRRVLPLHARRRPRRRSLAERRRSAIDYLVDAPRAGARPTPIAFPRTRRTSASCPSRSATRATRRIRCTRTGTTSGRSPVSARRRMLANVVGDIERVRRLHRAPRRLPRPICSRRVPRAMAMHAIDYVPGSVELGDFDPQLDRGRA